MCGMRRREDMDCAAQLGVDAVGLVFAPGSPRTLSLDEAAAMRGKRPLWTEVAALFVDPEAAWVNEVIRALAPTCLQFHGDESAEFCESFNMPYIKAIGASYDKEIEAKLGAYEASAGAFLIDVQTGSGGGGETFDWSAWARSAPDISLPCLLAGGLTPDNVGAALKCLHPWGVDVSSGIERERGVKDHELMRQFVDAVRKADSDNGQK